MKFPLFQRDKAAIVRGGDAQDRAERLLAESLRMLGEVCKKMAEVIETQRLQRQGYGAQDPLLRRLDTDTPAAKPKK